MKLRASCKFKVLITPGAMDDIRVAALWYNKQKQGFGKEFTMCIRESQDLLKINPFFVKRYKQVHTLPLKRFPFMLHFLIDEQKCTVTILAVLHTSLNPEKSWK